MSDDLVKQSIAELQDLVRCRCHPAYKDRKLHDPDCECDNAENVKVVADWIERLEANIDLKADFIDGTMNQLAASDQRIEELEAKLAKAVEERDEALNQLDSARHSVAVLEKRVKTFCDGWGIADKGRIEAEAKLAEAVEALEGAAQQHRIIAGMDLIGASAVAYNAARAAESKLASLQGDKT